MSFADDIRKNYVNESTDWDPCADVPFLLGTERILETILEDAKLVSRNQRSIAGYYNMTTDRGRAGLNPEWDDDVVLPMYYFLIEDFGEYREKLLENLKTACKADKCSICTQSKVNKAIEEIRRGLAGEGFKNINIKQVNIGKKGLLYEERESFLFKNPKPVFVKLPAYALYISFSW